MAADETNKLRARVAELEEEIRQLREALAPDTFAISPIDGLHMPRRIAVMFACLQKHGTVSRKKLYVALYGADGTADPKVIHVYVHGLRRMLEPHGYRIKTVWGQGYRLIEPASAGLAA
jgi:hypothetical protein